MTNHDNETLIRAAIAELASQSVDHRVVLAGLRQGRRPRRRPVALIALVAVAVVAGLVAVAVPLIAGRDTPTGNVTAQPAGTELNVLLVGLDDHGWADSIVLARMGADGGLRAVTIPRDTRVEDPGAGADRLSSLYSKAGMRGLMTTVQGITGVQVDHHATVDMRAFEQLSSSIGGVEVCLRAASRDNITGASFPAGRQTISGARALAFLRQRKDLPNGDLDRVVRQQVFLRALVAKMTGDPKALASLAAEVRATVRVDEGWDLTEFTRRLKPHATIDLATIPTLSGSQPGTLKVDPAAVRTFAGEFLAGKPQAGAPQPGPQGDIPCVN